MINRQSLAKYWKARLRRLKGTPNSIALGIACGVAISFTPFVGAHLMLAILIAWMIRGNVAVAALGTAAGNPWTFPFIWVSVFYTGRKILGLDYTKAADVDFASVFAKAIKALIKADFDLFFSDIWPILWPMMVGCVPFCLIVGAASYYVARLMLKR